MGYLIKRWLYTGEVPRVFIGAIAPTAEQLICTQKVAGANPAGST